MKAIHCIGVAVVDALSDPVERYPVPRLETQVTTDKVCFHPGGGAVNTSSALARMGIPAAIFTKIGKDFMGSFLLRELEKLGIDPTGIRVSTEDATPFTFVGIHPTGDRTFIHTPGANRTLSLEDFDWKRLLAADYLVYQDLWAMPRLDGSSGSEILAMARKAGVTTLLDECWGFGPNKEILERLLPHSSYVLPSFDDMQAIYPDASAQEIASALLDCGAGAAVIKMGAEGCLYARGKERIRIEAFPANVVDTTGAGDCWDAGFVAALASGEDPIDAVKIGNACAAFGIECVGGSNGVPAYAAVRARALR
jgi:sugar/nucleoside kinase (ribokinase family)